MFIITKGWETLPSKRPDINEVLQVLRSCNQCNKQKKSLDLERPFVQLSQTHDVRNANIPRVSLFKSCKQAPRELGRLNHSNSSFDSSLKKVRSRSEMSDNSKKELAPKDMFKESEN